MGLGFELVPPARKALMEAPLPMRGTALSQMQRPHHRLLMVDMALEESSTRKLAIMSRPPRPLR